HEEGRIRELVVWPEGAGQRWFPRDSTVHHILPIGFATNFLIKGMAGMSVGMLQHILSASPASRLYLLVNEINQNIEESRLDTPLRLSHFFAQVREEVGAAARLTESLNYSTTALVATFRYFSNNPEEAQAFGRVGGQVADQEAIANRAYSG